MNELIKSEDNRTEHIEHFQSLAGGQFWKAKADIQEECITEGMVLLIERLKYVSNELHTVVLRSHPSMYNRTILVESEGGVSRREKFTQHQFHFDRFLELFMFEPAGAQIRARELAFAQQEMFAQQQHIAEIGSSPQLLRAKIDERLAKDHPDKQLPVLVTPMRTFGQLTNTPMTALSDPNAVTDLREQLQEGIKSATAISKATAEILQEETQKASEIMTRMSTFLSETSAVALAQADDLIEVAKKVNLGIETLGLYTGEKVTCNRIKKGESAPEHDRLTLCQQRVYMDQELSVFSDVDEWFDYTNQEQFFKKLVDEPRFVEQIFPSPRCVVVIATRQNDIRYEDAYFGDPRNFYNRSSYLMIRDGENLFLVTSGIESHAQANRLFPSTDEGDNVFRGIDGSTISATDPRLSDAISKYGDITRHYTRLLILLCGLDHRESVMGHFYPGSKEGRKTFDFLSRGFQETYFNFLHDDDGEGMLGAEKLAHVGTWIQEMNEKIRPGSRVMCFTREMINEDSATGCYGREAYRFGRTERQIEYWPMEERAVYIAEKRDKTLIVKVPVSKQTSFNEKSREFQAAFDISNCPINSYLCLDFIDPKVLNKYIQSRSVRSNHAKYMRLFKEVLVQISKERAQEESTRMLLSTAILEGRIAGEDQVESLVDTAVAAWRASKRGEPLPVFERMPSATTDKDWKALLEQIYLHASTGDSIKQQIEDACREQGYQPLRHVVTGKAAEYLYAAPSKDEVDDRVLRHTWVHRFKVQRTKRSGITLKGKCWGTLHDGLSKETILHEWDLSNDWVTKVEAFSSHSKKQQLFDDVQTAFESGIAQIDQIDDEWISKRLIERDDFSRDFSTGGYVVMPVFFIPVGIYQIDGNVSVLGLTCSSVESMLYSRASERMKLFVKHKLYERYEKAEVHRARLSEEFSWSLRAINVDSYEVEGFWLSRTLSTSSVGYSDKESVRVDRYNHFNETSVDAALEGFKEYLSTSSRSRNKEKPKPSLWLVHGSEDGSGKYQFDTILGIDTRPMTAVLFKTDITFLDTKRKMTVIDIADISSVMGPDGKRDSSSYGVSVVSGAGGGSVSYQTASMVFHTKNEALIYLKGNWPDFTKGNSVNLEPAHEKFERYILT